MDRQFLRVRHRRAIFELGEPVPLFVPSTDQVNDADCEAVLHFHFNCSSECLPSQLPLSPECEGKPLILVSSLFIISTTGQLVRPVRELSRNFLVKIVNPPSDAGVARPSSDASAVACATSCPRFCPFRVQYSPSAPAYEVRTPDSPDYRPSSPPYAPPSPTYTPASPVYNYPSQAGPSTSGLNSTSSETASQRRRNPKRKASRVRFS